MVDIISERPAIHICLVGPVPQDLDLWVQMGAEEEGVPARTIREDADAADIVAAAYSAARSSRVDIGVAISSDRVVLHERHMPEEKPVLSFSFGVDPRGICRLMGGNAARMVTKLPLRFEEDLIETAVIPIEGKADDKRVQESRKAEEKPFQFQEENTGREDETVKLIVKLVCEKLRERG
jgi:hypothetical protein